MIKVMPTVNGIAGFCVRSSTCMCSTFAQVVEILVHPAYNSSNYQSDLALLILSSPVQFTKYVRPVCLWDKTEVDLENVINKEGTVSNILYCCVHHNLNKEFHSSWLLAHLLAH